jgi:hypothetical protein
MAATTSENARAGGIAKLCTVPLPVGLSFSSATARASTVTPLDVNSTPVTINIPETRQQVLFVVSRDGDVHCRGSCTICAAMLNRSRSLAAPIVS